jgi:4-oxalocrotonate tautomerase
MPLIEVHVIENVFNAEQKRQMISKLTDAMVSIEGEVMRGVTWVKISEVASGDWGIGGRPLTTEAVKELAAGRKVAVRPDALKLGAGRLQFSMTVDGVLDGVGTPDVMGRVDDTRVRVPLGPQSAPPLLGAQVVVSADRFSEVE